MCRVESCYNHCQLNTNISAKSKFVHHLSVFDHRVSKMPSRQVPGAQKRDKFSRLPSFLCITLLSLTPQPLRRVHKNAKIFTSAQLFVRHTTESDSVVSMIPQSQTLWYA